MEAISYKMYWTHNIYSILKDSDENPKEIHDKVECLQRSQIYLHNHIAEVERSINELKNLKLPQPADAESVVLTSEVN
jgi:prefoldin subunit 5